MEGKCVNLIALLVLLAAASSTKVEPKVKCTLGSMRVEVPITKSTGLVYLQGLRDYPDEACRPQRDTSGSLAILDLDLEDFYRCAITRVTNKLTGKQIFYHTLVVEEVPEGQNQPNREVIQVKCSTLPARNHTLSKRNVFPAGFQEPDDISNITDFITARAPAPKLGVGVRQGGKLVTGELNVSPGTLLKMEIFLDQESAPIYGILVNHMQATDTKNQEETMTYNGCAIDPYLFGNFKTTDGDFLVSEFRAFKFPDSSYVQFKGTVNVCLDMCVGVDCSGSTRGFGRRKREVSSSAADPNKIFEISITSFIKVKEENEEIEEVVKEHGKIYNDKKLIVDNQLKEKKIISYDPSNFKLEKITEEEHEYVIAENSSASAVVSVVLLFLTATFRIYL